MSARYDNGRRLVLAAVTVLALVAGGCGSNNGSAQPAGGKNVTGGIKTDPKLAAMVPASVKHGNQVIVATDPSYAPNEFFAPDNKTIVGMDPDLGKAIGKVLGLDFVFEKAGFDAIIPGLASGRYGLGMSSFTDNKKREKVVDFVTYFSAGTALMVKKGNPEKLGTEGDSLCGKRVAVEKGTVQEDPDLPARSKKCQAAGKSAISSLVYPDQNGANLALASGRADAVLADSPVAEYAAKQSSGQLQVVGTAYDTAPYGIAVPKTAGTFKDAVKGALEKLIQDGTYKQILAKWGIESGAVESPGVNGATS